MNILEQILQQTGFILTDGATGTELFKLGLENGAPPEIWNEDEPEKIASVHTSYVDAGSNLILTNSFGGTTFRLKLHDLQDRSYDFNFKAAQIARRVADQSLRPVIVAGSIGPTGEILTPMGSMTYEEAVEAFQIQAQGLHDGGVDAFWIETLSDLKEVQAAVEGIRAVSDRPICACLTFDTKGRTMMGVTPQAAARQLTEWGVFAFGANCGNGIEEIEAVIAQMREVAPEAILIAKSNAGIPQWINNELLYDGTPQIMAEYSTRVRSLGASIIGGCCGSAPEHICAMEDALRNYNNTLTITPRGYKIDEVADMAVASSGKRRRRRQRA